jgi:hypothetical protein
MPLHKLTIKLFAADDTFAPAEFVPIFHKWIQTQSLTDHLLIDVADYAHVPAGPGTLIVASEANIHMDRSDDRLGLLYVRKQPIKNATSFIEILRGVFGYALAAAAKMETDESFKGRLKFRIDEIAVGLNDRLLAPNMPETIAEYHPLITAFFTKLFPGEKITIEPHSKSPKELIDLRVKSSGTASIATLIERVKAITFDHAI